jgi:hypothetical protein
MKVLINTTYGGFGVSQEVKDELGYNHPEDMERFDPRLIAAVEKVGLNHASDGCSSLKIVEIPDDVEWYIMDCDGCETIHENHRIWF